MLKILFIGSLGVQSLITLKGILTGGHTVCALAVAGSTLGLGHKPGSRGRRFIPAFSRDSTETILNVASENGIAIKLIYPGIAQDHLYPYAPDVGIVSCYPHRLQDDLLQLPKFGCFNLHPSLLPKYRGPAPLFWQLRSGETLTGVSLHQMEHRMDAGNIVARAYVPIRDAVSEAELNRICAIRGTRLIHTALQQLEKGILGSVPQDEKLASYHSWPTERDFHLTPDWTARRIRNFIQGTRQRGKAYRLQMGRQLFLLDSVVESSHDRLPDKNYTVEGNCLRFNCYDGSVSARLAV